MSSNTIYTLILSSISHNKLYLNRYLKFIDYCNKINLINPPTKIERHHICPKSMFPKFKDFNQYPWNCVSLSHKQHFVAHHLLWKCYNNAEMRYAFRCMAYMTHQSIKLTARVYHQLMQDYKESLSLKMMGKENFFWGKKHTTKTIKTIKKTKKEIGLCLICDIVCANGDIERKITMKDFAEKYNIKYTALKKSYSQGRMLKSGIHVCFVHIVNSSGEYIKFKNRQNPPKPKKQKISREGIPHSETHRKNLTIANRNRDKSLYFIKNVCTGITFISSSYVARRNIGLKPFRRILTDKNFVSRKGWKLIGILE